MTVPSADFVPVVPQDFSPFSRWFSAAFRLFGEQWQVWVQQGLIALLLLGPPAVIQAVVMIYGFLNPATMEKYQSLVNACTAFSILVAIPLSAGMTYTALKQMRGEPIAFADLFRAGRFLLPFFAVNIIGGIMLILGLALCCIPGILVGGILTPTYALIVDRRIGSFKALGLSIQFCRQNLLLFAVYFLVVVLIYQFAAGFIIAIAFAYPLYTIAQAVAYYDLTYGLPGSSATPGAPAMPPTPPYQPPPIAP